MEISMKNLAVLFTLACSLVSFSANSLEVTKEIVIMPFASLAGTTLGFASTSNGVDCTLGQGGCKLAMQVVADSQEYFQSGTLSAFLSEKIKNIQAQDKSASDEEALDALISVSLEILK
jgi:hypothetical protein